MVDAPFDEGDDGWDAVAPTQDQPVQMEMQAQSVDDAFGDANFEVASPVII